MSFSSVLTLLLLGRRLNGVLGSMHSHIRFASPLVQFSGSLAITISLFSGFVVVAKQFYRLKTLLWRYSLLVTLHS